MKLGDLADALSIAEIREFMSPRMGHGEKPVPDDVRKNLTDACNLRRTALLHGTSPIEERDEHHRRMNEQVGELEKLNTRLWMLQHAVHEVDTNAYIIRGNTVHLQTLGVIYGLIKGANVERARIIAVLNDAPSEKVYG